MGTEHVSRFYSLALGREKNFNARTDGLIGISDGALDSTPDVSIYSLLFADTAGNASISYFDNGVEGQIVIVHNVNSGNISFIGANIMEQSSAPILNHDSIAFIMHNSSWLELFRSRVSAEYKANPYITTYTWVDASSTAGGPTNVYGLSLLACSSAGKMILKNLSGGAVAGQRLTIYPVGGGNLTLAGGTGGAAGAFRHASAQSLIITASGCANMIYDGTNWLIDGTLLSQI